MNYCSHSMKLFSAALFFALSFSQRDCQAQTWSGNGPDSNWSTASNWVGGGVPVSGSSSVVTFDNPSVRDNPNQNIADPLLLNRLIVEASLGSWSFSGQSIQFAGGGPGIIWNGTGAISVAQDWIVEGANFSASGSGTASSASTLIHNADIRGSQAFLLINRSLTSNGTFSGTGRVTVGGNGARLTVNGSVSSSVPTIQIGSDGNFAVNSGSLRGTGIVNSNVTTANGTQQSNTIGSSVALTVNGEILLNQSGQFQRLTVAEGTIVAKGAVRVASNSSFGIASGATLAGSGGIAVREWGKVSVNGNVQASQSFDVRQTFSTSLGNFSQLAGSGVIDGDVLLSGGRISGSLTLNGAVNVLQTAAIGGVGTHFGTGSGGDMTQSNLIVNGNVGFLGSGAVIAGNISGNGRLVIESGVTATMGIFTAGTVGVETVVRGTLNAPGSPTTFSNSGTIRLEGGTISTSNSWSVNSNVISTGAAAIMNVQTGTTFNGEVRVESGALTIGGIVEGTGSMTVLEGANQTLQNNTSRMRLTLNAFGNLVGTTGSRYENTVNLLGATMSGPLTMDGAVNVGNNETSNLVSGSTMNVTGVTSINSGTLRVASSASLTGGGTLIVNNGALDVQGLVMKNTVVEENGYLRGVGEVAGLVDIEGFLDPGNSAGTIKVRGAVDLKSSSTVCIEIGGTTPGTGYDVVQGLGLNSALNLHGGKLMLSLINGFVPLPSHQFDFFVGFSSITGSFGSGDGGDRVYFADGSFAIEYGEQSIGLTDFQPVPEPSAFLLILTAACPMLRRRRKVEA